MNKINVLILGVGGNVSQGIMAALKHSDISCNIIGACIGSESLGLYFCDKAYISPYANDENFMPWLRNLCVKEDIDVIFTGVEENIYAIEKNRKDIEDLKALFISAPLRCLDIGNNKLNTCTWLKENGLNYPKFADSSDETSVKQLVEEVGFPLIAKPCVGKGSAGVMKLTSIDDVIRVPKENYVIQECLGDDNSEYTIGCYVNKNNELEDMIICKRYLKYGTTFKAEIVQDETIAKECEQITKKFGAKGPLNIQLRMHKGKPVCFELNVRFSGTTPLRANWGFNDVRAMINEYILNEPCGLKPLKKGLAYRYFNEAYIDIDMQKQLAAEGFVENCKTYNNFKENF